MIEELLTQNGFSDKEARVYLAALELGEAPLARIASKAHLQRSTVYSLVDEMKKRGLLSLSKRGGIQYASVLPPRILIDRFKQAAQFAEQGLPQLMEMAYASPLKPRVRFYEGLQGLQEILYELSYSKEQSFIFTDYEQMPPELFAFIRKEIVPRRRKLNVFSHLILPRNPTNVKVQKEDAVQDLHFAEHRIVDFPRTKNPIEILLFDTSKIGFLSFTQHEMFGVIMDSPAIYETLRNLFELVWGLAKNGSNKTQ
jgi:HTH-type transcriptional regulator, sugar sensing transcriptional regulator